MKWHTGIILLPDTGPASPSWPAEAGDQMPASLLREFQQKAPTTLPLTLFRDKKLVLQAWSEKRGAQTATIPSLGSVAKLVPGRLHLLLLSGSPLLELTAYAGNKKRLEPVDIPYLTARMDYQRFFVHTEAPHFLLLDPCGVILTVESGYYLTKENIRAVARCRN